MLTGHRLIAPLAMAVALGGCTAATQTSAGNFRGPAHAVAQTIDNLSSDAGSHDGAKVCNGVLASALVAALDRSPGGCARVVGDQLSDADNPDIRVLSGGIRIAGNRATARVKSTFSGHDRLDTLTLVSQAGSWRISGCSTCPSPGVP